MPDLAGDGYAGLVVIASASGTPATVAAPVAADHVGERAVVVPVLVGGDDVGQPGVADQRQEHVARSRPRR